MENMDHDTFHKVLSRLMEERSLSIRKLGEISGIDHATISKIMNGKRKANITHFQKLSESLDVEITTLMEAAGYRTGSKKEEILEVQDLQKSIQHLIKITDSYDKEFTLDEVNLEIDKYREYSQTDEGKKKIYKGFKDKLDKLSNVGPYIEKLQWMYSRFLNKKGTTREL